MYLLNDVLDSNNVSAAAEIAKKAGLKPLIISNKKSYHYTSKDAIFADSHIALAIGDGLIEMRAITKAGINQMHNICKLYDIKTVHYSGKNSEHLLFYSTAFNTIIYDQLRLKCLNHQHGIFINIKHAFVIIPPSKGYKKLSNHELSLFPESLFQDLFNLHCDDIMKGSFNV